MLRLPVIAMPTGSVLLTAAFWEAARNQISCVRMTKILVINALSMMIATQDAANPDFALHTSHATIKEQPIKTQPISLR